MITLALISAGLVPAHSAPPLWVITAAGLAIALGTATGGWRIIRTLGRRMGDIESPQGFAAESASTAIILSSATSASPCPPPRWSPGRSSAPAVARRSATLQWRVAARVAIAWLLTLPGAALVGAFAARITATGTSGVALVTGLLLVSAAVIYGLSQRTRVTATTVNDIPTLRPVPVPRNRPSPSRRFADALVTARGRAAGRRVNAPARRISLWEKRCTFERGLPASGVRTCRWQAGAHRRSRTWRGGDTQEALADLPVIAT